MLAARGLAFAAKGRRFGSFTANAKPQAAEPAFTFLFDAITFRLSCSDSFKEERPLPSLDLWLTFFSLIGFSCGGWGLCWSRNDHRSLRAHWGRRLSILAILVLGLISLVATAHRSNLLVPLGILGGLLVVLMLWEQPEVAGSASER